MMVTYQYAEVTVNGAMCRLPHTGGKTIRIPHDAAVVLAGRNPAGSNRVSFTCSCRDGTIDSGQSEVFEVNDNENITLTVVDP